MEKEKNETISKLFEGKEIRSVWDSEIEDYHFSVIDVILTLTDSNIPKRYWSDLKRRLINEGSELYDKIVRLKMKAHDGKYRETDTLDTEGIFRLIESVPSPKAEPFKLWLAKLGRQKIDEVFDPSKGIDEMIDFYLRKGYSMEWIKRRINAIINRKDLTSTWKDLGINEESDYGLLTNIIYKEWSGMTAQQYKEFKGLRKESLRDNMDGLEISLTDISEEVTKRLAKKKQPKGLNENIKVAKDGGHVAKNTREDIERLLGERVISPNNNLNKKYFEEKNIKRIND